MNVLPELEYPQHPWNGTNDGHDCVTCIADHGQESIHETAGQKKSLTWFSGAYV